MRATTPASATPPVIIVEKLGGDGKDRIDSGVGLSSKRLEAAAPAYDVRQSIFFSAVSQYVTQFLTIGTTAAMARLLTPAETGLFMVASGVITLVDCFRDFGLGTYIIQKREIEADTIRTAFTITFIISVSFAVALWISAPHIAEFFDRPELSNLVVIGALGFVILPFYTPLISLLKREMSFLIIAKINAAAAISSSLVAVGFAAFGYGASSYLLGSLLASCLSVVMAYMARPQPRIFLPSLAEWRAISSFGGISSLNTLLNVGFDVLPRFALGRVLGIDAVGLYSRAFGLCQLPVGVIGSVVGPVVLPAMAARARLNGSLKESYLRGLSLVTAVQWPALAITALLAEPLVRILLGQQWLAAVPLVRIVALSTMFLAPAFMTYPVLVAVGRIRDTLVCSLIGLPPSGLIVIGAANLGLHQVALSTLITAPLQMSVALLFIRRAVAMSWGDLAEASAKSVLVTLGTILIPAMIIVGSPSGLDLDLPRAIVAAVGAGLGWVAAIYLSGHPLSRELYHASQAVRRRLDRHGRRPKAGHL